MKEKKTYSAPDVAVLYVSIDVITYSETEEWEGPAINAGLGEE